MIINEFHILSEKEGFGTQPGFRIYLFLDQLRGELNEKYRILEIYMREKWIDIRRI